MKRLTLNQVAKANIRVNRKAYISLFIGILLAVFLATCTSLCAWGTVRGHEEQMAQRVGWMDMYMLGSGGPTDDQLRDCGFFQRIGHVMVDACVKDTDVCTGFYDEEAEKLINRTLMEGRMPEKAGEIAAELSALIRMDKDKAQVGDVLTLTMKPVHGPEEQKTFTLVGILNEQTEYLNWDGYTEGEGMKLPSIVVSPEEKYAVGGVQVHRVLTYAPLITLNQVMRNCPLDLGRYVAGVSRETGEAVYYDSGWNRARDLVNRIGLWVVFGAALMLSACIGITTAMESLLSRKTEDIGMLRAIGATRRQIRRIYGAEAWMLAATALPAGLLLGIGATRIISVLSRGQVMFSPQIWLLIPILGLSGLCVFVASRLPLYHASAQMPMGVLRDTGMLRRAGKLKNHSAFKPDTLIAGRRVRLHPLRQAGTAGMIALTLLSTLLLGEVVLGIKNQDGEYPAYELYNLGNTYTEDRFSQCESGAEDVRYEIRKISGMDGVSKVRANTEITANLLMDEIPEYLKDRTLTGVTEDGAEIRYSINALGVFGEPDTWLYFTDEELADARARSNVDWTASDLVMNVDRMELIRSKLGIAEKVVPISIMIADVDPEELKEWVVDGTIDPEKMDSGEQVLVYAPTVCVRMMKQGGAQIETEQISGQVKDDEWDLVIRNDHFKKGMPLSLLELAGNKAEDVPNEMPVGANWKAWYQSMEAVQADVSIGAVLSGSPMICSGYASGLTVIVSEKGAQALGLKLPNPGMVEVYLSDGLTPEQEELIENQLRQIGNRGWLGFENELRINRARQAKKIREILILAGMTLLFFAVSVFMQVSGVSRQIRSDTRMIGTLRAVGADLKMLVGCYRLPVWICAACAMIPCLLFYAVSGIPALRLFTLCHPQIMIPVLAILAACVALACTAGIRGRLYQVSRRPIVENIREL